MPTIYEIKIIDDKYCFCSNNGNIYEVYFSINQELSLSPLKWLSAKTELVEFGFDRFILGKKDVDSDSVSVTIQTVLKTYNMRDKIIYSQVVNPAGNNMALTKVYVNRLVSQNIIKSLPLVVITISSEKYNRIIFLFYHKYISLNIQNFIELVVLCLRELFEFYDNPIEVDYKIINL